MMFHDAKVQFEVAINLNGNFYLVIIGEHINGYFCCIPNWHVGCEMSDPNDTFYNVERLTETGLDVETAKALAAEIRKTWKILGKGRE